ncbi:MAG TPA: YheC/YheD family protein [Patescibacteria group bacterium]|nr:YheC/YheD family protein [Patescibacteria group bacterium]
MEKTTSFDVLIVYSGEIACSARSLNDDSSPFGASGTRTHYDSAYAYLLEMCAKKGLTAAFSTSLDITGPGTCSSYWLYSDNAWQRVQESCSSRVIFDKFSSLKTELRHHRDLLFSDGVRPFTNDYLLQLFGDKLKTYDAFPTFAIPTVIIEDGAEASIRDAIDKLILLRSLHPNGNDFAHSFVLKNRFGAGGNEIYKIAKHVPHQAIFDIMDSDKAISFILQPFTKFEKGYSHNGSQRPTDIRLIYQNGKIVQTYIREAKKGDFRCNEHQGGDLTYVSPENIPTAIKEFSQQIATVLADTDSLFALDFIVSNDGNIYFIEGNSQPGIDWNLSLATNEREAKRLIRGIVRELLRRVEAQNPAYTA